MIEFVDPTGTGEFHMTMDPGEKDALANDARRRGEPSRNDGHVLQESALQPHRRFHRAVSNNGL